MIYLKALTLPIAFISLCLPACVTTHSKVDRPVSEPQGLIAEKIRQIMDQGSCQADFPMANRTWGDLAYERTAALQCLSSCQTILEKIRLVLE